MMPGLANAFSPGNNSMKYAAAAIAAVLAAAGPVVAQEATMPSAKAEGDAFVECLRARVQTGIEERVDPATFKTDFALACGDEQAAFRAAMIARFVARGASEDEAAAQVDSQIAAGRARFVADQARFVAIDTPAEVVGR